MLATVLAHYETNIIVPKRRSPDRKTTVEQNFLLTRKRLMDFLSEKQPDGSMRSPNGKAARVSELDLPTQRAFWRRLVKMGCSASSISVYMTSIAAAINDAAKPRIVERDGREEETSILTHPVRITYRVEAIAEALDLPVGTARDWVPTMKQMADVLDDCAEHVFRYLIIALNTWARPEAVGDLNFETHVDVEHRLVNLLPAGRAQNHKRRPMIPLTDTLLGWHLTWNEAHPVRWEGERVVNVKKALKRVGDALGMPQLNRYTVRHFMATKVRHQKLSRGRRVTREQRSIWLGHTVKEGSTTTEWYETYDPDFLSEAKEATDMIMRELDRLMSKRRLLPPAMQRGRIGLALVRGGKA